MPTARRNTCSKERYVNRAKSQRKGTELCSRALVLMSTRSNYLREALVIAKVPVLLGIGVTAEAPKCGAGIWPHHRVFPTRVTAPSLGLD
jgi:hypothetical protein